MDGMWTLSVRPVAWRQPLLHNSADGLSMRGVVAGVESGEDGF